MVLRCWSFLRKAIQGFVRFFWTAANIRQTRTRRGSGTPLADGKVYKSTIAPDGIQHVRIEGGSYFFTPSRVIVRVNVPVELAVSVDSGVVPHSLVIQAPEAGITVDERLSPATRIVRFTPTKTGKYPFYCNNKLLFFKSHREKGMEGLLDVVE